MPRIMANWSSAVARDRRGGGVTTFTEAVVAARQRVRHAFDAAGPEFIGLLLDVCCFLRGSKTWNATAGARRAPPMWCGAPRPPAPPATTATPRKRAVVNTPPCAP